MPESGVTKGPCLKKEVTLSASPDQAREGADAWASFDPDIITHMNDAPLDDAAADTAAPFRHKGRSQSPMSLLHQTAGLRLLSHFEDQSPDTQALAFPRDGDALDKEIGAPRYPGKLHAKVRAGGLPALTKQYCHLAAEFAAVRIAVNTTDNVHDGVGRLYQRCPIYRRTGYSKQSPHCFTPIDNVFDKNYILLPYLLI